MIKKKTLYDKLLLLFFCSVIKILYDVNILTLLPSKYNLYSSYLVSFNELKYVCGFCLYIFFCSIYIINEKKSLFDYFFFLLLIFSFMPVCSSFGINDASWEYFFYQLFYWICFFIYYRFFRNIEIKPVVFSRIRIKENVFQKILIIFLLITYIVIALFIYRMNRFKISFAISDVYDCRENNSGLPIWFSWLKNSFGTFIVPFFIVYFGIKKKYFLFFSSILLQILLFSVGMDKAYLLKIPIALMVMLVSNKKDFRTLTILGFILLFSFSFLEKIFFKSTFLFYVIVRRIFYIPTWMNLIFFNFFSNNEKIFFTQDTFLISKFLPSRYKDSVYNLVNDYFFNGLVPSPNTGMFAEAYMQMGFVGLFIFPLLIIAIYQFFSVYLSFFSIKCRYVFVITLSMFLINVPISGGYFCSVCIVTFCIIYLFGIKRSKNLYLC